MRSRAASESGSKRTSTSTVDSRGHEIFAAIAGYAYHGRRRDTTNQFHPPAASIGAFMTTLIAAEIGGWLVLVAGFLDGQVL